jgi:tetratricopeptide (TPR) repeat protein
MHIRNGGLKGLIISIGVVSAVAVASQATMARAAPVGVSPPPVPAESFAGNYLAARIAGRAKDTRAESTFLRESLRRAPGDVELLRQAFTASVLNGDIEEAARLGSRIDATDATGALARFVDGVNALRSGRFSDARREFARMGSGRFETAALILTAWAHYGEGAADQALELLDRIKEDRLVWFRDYHAGLISDARGYTYEARKRFRSLYQVDSRSLRTVDAYARFLSRTGAWDEARSVYLAFDRQFPRNPFIQAALRDLDAGRLLSPIAADARAGAAEALYGVGIASAQQTDPQSGLIFHRLALHLDPTHSLAWVAVGEVYTRLRQPERALEAYAGIPSASPLRAVADAQSGLLLQSMERPADAEKALRAAVAARPDDLRSVETLADVLRMQKNWAEAARVYTKGVGMIGAPQPTDWRWFFMRAIAYERSGDWPRAEADLKQALALNPDSPQALNYLAYTWADRGERLEEARVMLEKAVGLAKNDGHIVDSLGWVYYRLGRYEDALRELERALTMVPGEAVVNEHLGDVYWRLGRKREAVFKWRHARDLKPEPDELERIEKKLHDAEAEFGGKLP